MNDDSGVSLLVTGDLDLAEEWKLVLLSQGLSPRIHWSSEGLVLSVPATEVDRARAGLSAYQRENAAKAEPSSAPAEMPGALAASAAAGLLIPFFFSITVKWLPNVPWFERGSADAYRILHGELWRTVTALTLHADVAHAVSNAFAAALFFGGVFSVLGPGLGFALVLAAGVIGNFANALMRGAPHLSLGASTMVFGALGLLGGLSVARHRQRASGRRRAWLPIFAALALLGILGTAGERVDVWAHLLGLLAGGVLGLAAAPLARHPPGDRAQWTWGGAATALVIYCWLLALG